MNGGGLVGREAGMLQLPGQLIVRAGRSKLHIEPQIGSCETGDRVAVYVLEKDGVVERPIYVKESKMSAKKFPVKTFIKWEEYENDDPIMLCGLDPKEFAKANETVSVGEYELVRVVRVSADAVIQPVETKN